MSRSVSAPSSVTKTSPCWNGLIVPGSTLRYGSNFWSWTRSPRALSRRPSEAATIPFPRADTTPPVTKTYFGARVLTGFQGSSVSGGCLLRRRADEVGEPSERLRRKVAADAPEPRRLAGERRRRAVLRRLELEHDVEALPGHLEREPPLGLDLEHEEAARQLGTPAQARLHRALDLPVRARSQRVPHARLHSHDARPPVAEALGIGEHGPDL